jgi:N-acyl-D-aspartate/D-glutamate deacylase
MKYDVLIRDGLVFDGSGAAGRRADVAIMEGRIAAIGDLGDADAAKLIEASGLAVAPGFIDIKTHSDFTLPINLKAESKVRQGVTTEIIGHCGFSVAPCLPGKVDVLRSYLSASAPSLPFREIDFPQYLETFPSTSVNAGMLVGHNTLRLMVMGMDARPPSRQELARMTELLEEGLDAGALGMSTGLFTTPGSYAGREEVLALAAVLKRYNAGYFTHLRDESNHLIEAVKEAIEVGERCGVHVEIVHFTLMRSPEVLVGSDGNCVATYGIVSQGMPHPRFYGTFPRAIARYVEEQKLLPLEAALYKVTGGPAKALKLRDRGLLREGYRADVVLFDPTDFRDRATYENPHQYPSGSRTTVIVNAIIVVENATHTRRAPRALSRHGELT